MRKSRFTGLRRYGRADDWDHPRGGSRSGGERQLETENARLKKLVAERELEIEVMKEVAAKNWKRASALRHPLPRLGSCNHPIGTRVHVAFFAACGVSDMTQSFGVPLPGQQSYKPLQSGCRVQNQISRNRLRVA
jgi:hypothetical protein